eukprot:409454_1
MPELDLKLFGLSWFAISSVLEIWLIIAVLLSATEEDCGWAPVDGGDWFGVIVFLILWCIQFGIGQFIGLVAYQQSKNQPVGNLNKWGMYGIECIALIFIVLNVLSIASNISEKAYEECWTGEMMLVTMCINFVYSVVTLVFCYFILPSTTQDDMAHQPLPQADDAGDDGDHEVVVEDHEVVVQDHEVVVEEEKAGDAGDAGDATTDNQQQEQQQEPQKEAQK